VPAVRKLLYCVIMLAACSGPRRHSDADADADRDADVDVGSDADSDADGEADDVDADADDPWVLPDSDIETPEQVPNCGDGIVDEGEQCDDHNRLNGDGCDWLCRLGDGERPPTDPDPDVPEVEPEGSPATVEGTPDHETDNIVDLPLVWTGEVLATAFQEAVEVYPTYTVQVRFRRFDPDGTTLYPEWTYPLDGYTIGIDLVWTGDGFGFFFADTEVGIYFLWLDALMKPDDDPVLVVEAAGVQEISADWSGDGFVLAWTQISDREGPACWDSTHHGNVAETWVRLLGPRGETDGVTEPILVDDWSEWHQSPIVAAGGGGFALLTFPAATEDDPTCPAEVLRLGPDLATERSTGALSSTSGGDLLFDGERFVVGWTVDDARRETINYSLCQVDVDVDGFLAGPAVCEVPAVDEPMQWMGPTRFAFDGVGFLHVFYGMLGVSHPRDARLWAQRTDRRGLHVGAPLDITAESPGYAVARIDEGFGVLYLEEGEPSPGGDTHMTTDLRYQRFVPVE
jgi:cysteine-rich repeat protein